MTSSEAAARFDDLVVQVARRPGIYVGRCSLRLVSTYLDGYADALDDNDLGGPMDGWGTWVYRRFMIWDTAWHWTRVMLHVYGTDEQALAAMPALYGEYAAQRASMDIDGMLAELRQLLAAEHGQDSYAPETTHTPDPWQ